jgi:putative ABC transport system ATP-binding protein
LSPPLAISGLKFAYRGKPVFDHFDLTLATGEHRLLTGPSGTGKSTLINLMCGLLRPDAGRILVAGQAISEGNEARRDAIRRDCIGVVFQTMRLVSALDVVGNLRLAGQLARRPVSRSEAHALLAELGLAGLEQARPDQLSQGEAQRAAIARALVVRPQLLIADEPTSSLDDANAQQVGALLLRLARDHGTTLLVATHDARLMPLFGPPIRLKPPGDGAGR